MHNNFLTTDDYSSLNSTNRYDSSHDYNESYTTNYDDFYTTVFDNVTSVNGT